MPRSFHWSIASRHFRRFPASTLRLILSIALCAAILSVCIGVYLQLSAKHQARLESATISLFLKEEVDPQTATDLASDLMKDARVERVDIDTPDSLRLHFNDRFGVNVAEVLPQNPFTSVLRVHLRSSLLNVDTFMSLVQQYRELRTVVEDVGYQSEYVKAVLLESQLLLWTAILGTLSLLFLIGGLLFYALRAESRFAADDHAVVQLLGGRRSFLNRSALLRVLLCTLLGLLIGCAAAWLLVVVGQNSQLIPIHESNLLAIAYAAGVVLVLLVMLNRLSRARQ